jgi:hypothetical protein
MGGFPRGRSTRLSSEHQIAARVGEWAETFPRPKTSRDDGWESDPGRSDSDEDVLAPDVGTARKRKVRARKGASAAVRGAHDRTSTSHIPSYTAGHDPQGPFRRRRRGRGHRRCSRAQAHEAGAGRPVQPAAVR